MSFFKGKNVIVGVTASIAAYKSAFLVREFVKQGANVRVIQTPESQKFITPLTLSTLSKNPVLSGLVKEEDKDVLEQPRRNRSLGRFICYCTRNC